MTLVGIDEWPDVRSTTHHTAVKQHHCSECGRIIEPGETYRRDFSVVMGEAESQKYCSDCEDLMQAFFSAIPNEERHLLTFEVGGLRAAIMELRDEYGAEVDDFEYPQALDLPRPG